MAPRIRRGGGVTDHGQLTGLGDAADHLLYSLVDGTRAYTGTVGGVSPVASADLATRGFVEAQFDGRSFKTSARVATIANIDLSSAPAAIDSITMASTERVVVKNQTATEENGLYLYNGSGSAMTRTTDANTAAELNGAAVAVREGTVNADTAWLQTAEVVTLDTDAVTWSQWPALPVGNAGGDLSGSYPNPVVETAGGRIVKTTDDLAVLANALSAGGHLILEPGAHTLTAAIALSVANITIEGPRGARIIGDGTLAQLIGLAAGADGFHLIGCSLEALTGDGHCIAITGAVDRGLIDHTHFEKGGTATAGSGITFGANANDWHLVHLDFDGTNLQHLIATTAGTQTRLKIIGGSGRGSASLDQIDFDSTAVTDSVINGITLEGSDQHAIDFTTGCERITVTGCTLVGMDADAVHLSASATHCTVVGNTISGDSGTDNGVQVLGPDNVVHSNTIVGASTPAGVGILVTGSSAVRNSVGPNQIDSWVTGLSVTANAGAANKYHGNVFGADNTTDQSILADDQITDLSLNPLVFPAAAFGDVDGADFAVNANAPAISDENDNSLIVRRFVDSTETGFWFRVNVPVGAQRLRVAGIIRQEDATPVAGNVQLSWYERQITGTPTAYPAGGSPNQDFAVIALAADEVGVEFTEEFSMSDLGIAADQRHQVQFNRRPAAAGDTVTGSNINLEYLELTFV